MIEAKILIAEDDEDIRSLINRMVEKGGFKTILVGDGEHALKVLKEETPVAILLDYMMPKINGIETLKEIRRQDRFAETPVIMITSMGDQKTVLEACKAGANDFIVKPPDYKELINRLRRQTLTLEPDIVKKIIPTLNMKDHSLFDQPGLKHLSKDNFEAYQTNYEEDLKLCFVVPSNTSLKTISELSTDRLAKTLNVYVHAYRWKLVWPEPSEYWFENRLGKDGKLIVDPADMVDPELLAEIQKENQKENV